MSTILCELCGTEVPREGNTQKYCKVCSLKRRRERNRHHTKRWRDSNTSASERTKKRSEHRKAMDQQYGHCVYKHVDPETGETVYVGSGSFSRATSCRKGGGFQRYDAHAEWYKKHRRKGNIETYRDYVVLVYTNLPSRGAAYIKEGEVAIQEIANGARLFNREIPNPSRRDG